DAVRRSTKQIHPELRRIARLLPRSVATPRTLWLARRLSGLARKGADDVAVVEVAPELTVRVHRPPGEHPTTGLLWIHPGGYVMGTASMHDAFCRRLARELGATVAAV